MRSRTKTIAVFCSFLLLSAGCSQSPNPDKQQAATTSTGAADSNATGKQKFQLKDDRLTLFQARDRYMAQYRLKPDKQFMLAIGDVHHFLTGQQPEDVECNFSDNYWHLRYAGTDVGKISDLADFDELYKLLVDWCKKINAEHPLKLNLDLLAESETVRKTRRKVGSFSPTDLMSELRELNEKWQDGDLSASILARSADALAKLSYQRVDLMQVADQLVAEALCMMALSEAVCKQDETENRCYLADAMRYSAVARTISGKLDADDPLRLYLNDDETALLKLSAPSLAHNEEAAYFAAKLLAKKHNQTKWKTFVVQHFSDKPSMTLSVLNTFLPEAEDQSLISIGNLIIAESLAELQIKPTKKLALTADQLDWSSELSKSALDWMMSDLLAQFERALTQFNQSEKTYKSAQLLYDRKITENYYFGCFSSSIYLLARAYFALPFQRIVCEDFAKSLHVQSDTSAHELEVWLKDRIALKMQRINSGKLADDLGNSAHLGAPALINIFTDLGDYNVFDSPANVIALSKNLFARLDSRLSNRLEIARIADGTLLDVALTRSLLDSIKRNGLKAELSQISDQMNVEDASLIPSAIQEIKNPKIDARRRLKLLIYLQNQCFFKPKINAKLRRFVDEQYRLQIAKEPHNWIAMNDYGQFLLQFQDDARLRDQLKLWLAKQTKIDVATERMARCLLSQAFYELKDYRGGLSALGKFRDDEELHCATWRTLETNGLGQKQAAETSMRQLLEENPKNPSVVLSAAGMFWSNQEYNEAAEVIKNGNIAYADWGVLASILTQTFAREPQKIILAVEALRHAGFNNEINILSDKAYFLGKSDLAFSIAAVDLPAVPANYLRIVNAYRCLKDWKGRQNALQWISAKVPLKNRSLLAWPAFSVGQYELLWDFIPNQLPNQDNFVWVLRAAAAVGNKDLKPEYKKQLNLHFTSGTDAESELGRFLTANSKDIFARRLYPREICSSAFFIAWKGLRNGDNYGDQNAWLHVALETGEFRMSEYQQAWFWLREIQQEIVNQTALRKTATVRVARILDQPEDHLESPFNPGSKVHLE